MYISLKEREKYITLTTILTAKINKLLYGNENQQKSYKA